MTLEKHLESDIVDFADVRGWWSAKFTSPGTPGVPDRIFIRRGRHVFIEVKAPGEVARPQQERRIRDMRAHGAEVHVVDNMELARAILR